MPIRQVAQSDPASPLHRRNPLANYLDDTFRLSQAKKFLLEGPGAFSMQECVDISTHCHRELADDRLFQLVQKERIEKWEKEHPYAAKVHRVSNVICDFSHQYFKPIFGTLVIITVFFYPQHGDSPP